MKYFCILLYDTFFHSIWLFILPLSTFFLKLPLILILWWVIANFLFLNFLFFNYCSSVFEQISHLDIVMSFCLVHLVVHLFFRYFSFFYCSYIVNINFWLYICSSVYFQGTVLWQTSQVYTSQRQICAFHQDGSIIFIEGKFNRPLKLKYKMPPIWFKHIYFITSIHSTYTHQITGGFGWKQKLIRTLSNLCQGCCYGLSN